MIVNFDNIWGFIPVIIYLLVLYLGIVEFVKSKPKNSGGVINANHLDKHRNILLAAVVALILLAVGVYHITLTPIQYYIEASRLGEAVKMVDGIAYIDLSQFESNDLKTLLTGFSSQAMILLSVGVFIFFYSAINHLRCERKDTPADEKNLYQ